MAITNPDVSLSKEELYRKKKKEEKAKEKELKRLKAALKAEAAKLKELETGVYPTRGQIYVKGHTRKNGNIVNGKVFEVVASLQAISSESSSSTQGSVSNFSNDDYSQVKGPEKRGYIRCVGRMLTIKKGGFFYKKSRSSYGGIKSRGGCYGQNNPREYSKFKFVCSSKQAEH